MWLVFGLVTVSIPWFVIISRRYYYSYNSLPRPEVNKDESEEEEEQE